MAHVSEVESGGRCACVCPGCGAPLVAKKGARIDHHFAHEGTTDGMPCRTGPETALHKFAKEILGRRLHLELPPLTLEEGGDRWIGYGGGRYRFDGADLEQRLGGIVPDVIVRRGDRDLLVEMAVTHSCGPEKIETIRSMDVAAIEIDLAGLPRDVSRADLEASILEAAPRRWIHNPHLADGRAELERRRALRQASARRRAQALAATYAKAMQELGAIRPSSKVFGEMTRDGFGTSIGIQVSGAGCFTVPPGDWQAELLSGMWDAYQARQTTTFTEYSVVSPDEHKIRQRVVPETRIPCSHNLLPVVLHGMTSTAVGSRRATERPTLPHSRSWGADRWLSIIPVIRDGDRVPAPQAPTTGLSARPIREERNNLR